MDSAPEQTSTLPVLDNAHTPTAPPWARILIIGALVIVSIIATIEGFSLRRSEFERTQSVRFYGDVSNGFNWGQIGNNAGLFLVYDAYASGRIRFYPNELDYTPLRLTIVTLWARWAAVHYPDARAWKNDYDFTWPMMTLNSLAELVAAGLVFLLIRYWIIRADDARRPPDQAPRAFRGVVRGMIGALLLWFNPAVIWDAHAFPQWDVWNMPFFLGAVLLGCLDWWFAAGCCIVIGAFLKGQILLVAPMLLIWQIVLLRWDSILRFSCGFALVAAILAFPWMRPSPSEIRWLVLTLVSLATIAPLALRWRMHWSWELGLSIAALAFAWPWGSSAAPLWRCAPIGLIALVSMTRLIPARLAPHIFALAVGSVVFLMIPLFHVSTAWYRQGFEFGTQKQMKMAAEETINLPAVLVASYRWSDNPQALVRLPLIDRKIEFRTLMLLAYGACLVLCGIGAAIHDRRNDTRFLVTVVAPWLCWFVLLTQLSNRYLVWPAAFSALLAGVDVGMMLLGIIVSILGWVGIAQIMYLRSGGGDRETTRLLSVLHPHLAWPLMLAAAVYLWIAVTPHRRSELKRL